MTKQEPAKEITMGEAMELIRSGKSGINKVIRLLSKEKVIDPEYNTIVKAMIDEGEAKSIGPEIRRFPDGSLTKETALLLLEGSIKPKPRFSDVLENFEKFQLGEEEKAEIKRRAETEYFKTENFKIEVSGGGESRR